MRKRGEKRELDSVAPDAAAVDVAASEAVAVESVVVVEDEVVAVVVVVERFAAVTLVAGVADSFAAWLRIADFETVLGTPTHQ